MSTECFGLFAKYWQPGQVKTRLAASLGAEQAAEIYRQFVLTMLRRFSACCDCKLLVYAPPERGQEFKQSTPDGWQLEPQADGDLGRRMQQFFARRLEAGCQRVVLLGSDSPNVPLEYVEQAFQRLRQCDVVLGPTDDGGYWLIGVSSDVPALFSDIPWSTPQVWPATINALQAAGVGYETLPAWYDVDRAEDLKRLIADLRADAGRDQPLDGLLQTL